MFWIGQMPKLVYAVSSESVGPAKHNLQRSRYRAVERLGSMPKITFNNQTLECNEGDNLRWVLPEAKLPLYNGIAKAIHCRGLETCGTCAVEIDGPVSDLTTVEKCRLGFPPHKSDSGLRLACQCKVLGN